MKIIHETLFLYPLWPALVRLLSTRCPHRPASFPILKHAGHEWGHEYPNAEQMQVLIRVFVVFSRPAPLRALRGTTFCHFLALSDNERHNVQDDDWIG